LPDRQALFPQARPRRLLRPARRPQRRPNMQLMNTPAIRLGIVGVSRDCFPVSLTQKRLAAVMRELKKLKVDAVAASVTIENEQQAVAACDELLARGCNAAVAYLGNFGPEGP